MQVNYSKRRVYLYLRRHYPDQVLSGQGPEFGCNLSLAYAKHPEVSWQRYKTDFICLNFYTNIFLKSIKPLFFHGYTMKKHD